MVFSLFGLNLRVMRPEHLEMVRVGRNSDAVKKYMHFTEEITPAMQQKWFTSIDNLNHLFCVIEYDGKQPGIAYARDINYETSRFEHGTLIWDTSLHDGVVGSAATLAMNELMFNLYQIDTVYFHFLKDNIRSFRNQDQLGAKIVMEENGMTYRAEGTAEGQYNKKYQKYLKAVQTVMGTDDSVNIYIEKKYDAPELIAHIKQLYQNLSAACSHRYSIRSIEEYK